MSDNERNNSVYYDRILRIILSFSMFFRHVILYDIIHVFTTNERIFCRCIFTTKKESKKLIRFFDSFIHSILYSNMNSYFLKKSGILIDCSFTRLVGVLGVSMEGDVPPTVLLGTSGYSTVLFTDPILISSFGAACWRTGCLSYAEACPVCVAVCPTFAAGRWLSSLDFNLEAVPPTL